MKRITIKDIAKTLGYSIGTVSKALADSHEISEVTKVEIQKFADENGYQYNQYAKLLRTGKTNIIGMIVPKIGNSFFSQILEGIEEKMSKTVYNLIIMQSYDDPVRELNLLETLFKKGADAIIIAPTGNCISLDYLRKLKKDGIPVVLIDRINYAISTHKIGIDNFRAVYQGISHLISMGCMDILFISSMAKGVVEERRRGYLQCLNDSGIQINYENLLSIDVEKNGENSREELIKYFAQRIQENILPDAIFTASDQLTYQVLEVLHALNIEVPKIIALLGFANFTFSNLFSPPLSCIVQPSKEMGSKAFALIEEILDKPDRQESSSFEDIKLPVKMEIRRSTN
ncbi:LacI family DNA-binding transcriptional regulator [Sphingobacterium sp.]|uniref:LacI family DNA-binding transcriptional regulator n=2 Tax=unclassified Sphingobacterium TaxID=2609468 RepID=UPI0028A8B99F|nr:LacI family DNA-binding transcriptional regulator [Sphingobacterium sp.]